ncbi:MAG: hypothetical protein ABSH48_03125 [Verrucomicrobiota bacterium]|jgi:hypothetical protein
MPIPLSPLSGYRHANSLSLDSFFSFLFHSGWLISHPVFGVPFYLPAMVFHKPWPTIKPNATMATAKMQAATATSISHVLLSMPQIIA